MQQNFEQIAAAQKAMADAIAQLERLADKVGMARQIVEFAGDRRKAALSVLVVEMFKIHESTVAAEHHARADSRYAEKMKEIQTQTAEAEKVIKQWELAKIKHDSARSILSMEKTLLDM